MKKMLLYCYIIQCEPCGWCCSASFAIFSSNIVNDNWRSPICVQCQVGYHSKLETCLKPDSTR